MYNFNDEHELFENDYNDEQILNDDMFDDYEPDCDDSDDEYAFASAGRGEDESYGFYGSEF